MNPRDSRFWLLPLAVLLLAGCSDEPPTLAVTATRSWVIPPDGPKVPAPRGIRAAPDGEVFALDTSGRVLAYAKDGSFLRHWSMPDTEVGHPENLRVLSDGSVAVPDTHYHRVLIFSRTGEILQSFGTLGREPGEFIYPVSLAESANGDLFICEYGSNDRVQRFTRAGEYVSGFGSFGTGPGQFQRPSGIIWREGLLYVADAVNNRIQVFSEDGEFLRVLGDVKLQMPYDLDFDGAGAFYVIEWGAGRVSKLDLEGRLLARFGKPGSGRSDMRTPWGISWHDGRILIADTGNRRILELTLE
ncbi:MAG: iron(III) transport system ATP-binding protein [Rhodothermales bacterium]|jgi:iron(III) transport system ATP-binding protein